MEAFHVFRDTHGFDFIRRDSTREVSSVAPNGVTFFSATLHFPAIVTSSSSCSYLDTDGSVPELCRHL